MVLDYGWWRFDVAGGDLLFVICCIVVVRFCVALRYVVLCWTRVVLYAFRYVFLCVSGGLLSNTTQHEISGGALLCYVIG